MWGEEKSSWLLTLVVFSYDRPLVFVCCNLPLVTDYCTDDKLATTVLMQAAICFVSRVLSGSVGLRQTPDVDPADEPSYSGPEDES